MVICIFHFSFFLFFHSLPIKPFDYRHVKTYDKSNN